MASVDKISPFSRRWWKVSIWGVVFLLVCVLTIYLAQVSSTLPNAWRHASLAFLLLGLYAFHRGILSLRTSCTSIGWKWVIVAVSAMLVVAIVGMAIADELDDPFVQKAKRATSGLLSGSARIVGKLFRTLVDVTRDVVYNVFPASDAPQPEPQYHISIGDQVILDRISGDRVLSRTLPGVDQEVGTRFERQSILTVVDGPVYADDYKWWKLEGSSGIGWCAEKWISPLLSD
jgi:hypothetical protein